MCVCISVVFTWASYDKMDLKSMTCAYAFIFKQVDVLFEYCTVCIGLLSNFFLFPPCSFGLSPFSLSLSLPAFFLFLSPGTGSHASTHDPSLSSRPAVSSSCRSSTTGLPLSARNVLQARYTHTYKHTHTETYMHTETYACTHTCYRNRCNPMTV